MAFTSLLDEVSYVFHCEPLAIKGRAISPAKGEVSTLVFLYFLLTLLCALKKCCVENPALGGNGKKKKV